MNLRNSGGHSPTVISRLKIPVTELEGVTEVVTMERMACYGGGVLGEGRA